MATIADNIQSMAELVASVKKSTRLTETTILRIVDMNFALAQSSGAPTFSGGEDFPTEEEEIPEGQLELFPENIEGDDEALAALNTEETNGSE